jgi:septal ring-binding cell division protein DamX
MFFTGWGISNKIFFITYLAMSVTMLMSKLAWASDYQDGVSAYIDGDFDLAREHWLEAVKDQDARSMFNLGLLHEQNKLPTSVNDTANNWYRLAAENGYTPATYHLAQRLLERGGSDEQAITLIQRAADQGYAPARRHLGLPVATAVDADSGVAFESEVFEASELGYQTESWINRQQDSYWTIQLLAFTEKEQVLAFIEDHSLQRKTAYFTEVQNGEVFYKLVYGSFKSKDIASLARQNLGPLLQQHSPWLRTWQSVQQITK